MGADIIFGLRKAAKDEKIFVNYRRDDAGGFAGRLSDSLSQYFGVDRVFRDVTGIDYGHDFEQVIDDKLGESGALIVVIGDRWTSVAGEDGKRRLDDPEDYVMREIAIALDKRMPVLPVLIGDARMPGVEDLPASIAGLARRNAMTITDERWEHDVDRLAKVLSIDVRGSVAQRKLDMLKHLAIASLFAAALLATLGFASALLGPGGLPNLRANGFTPLLASVPFFGVIGAGVCAIVAVRDLEVGKQRYGWGAVIVATVGTLVTFLHYVITNNQTPIQALIVSYAGVAITLVAMLALIALAGFRAK